MIYNDIYKLFVKSIYSNGYKVSYCDNIDSKFLYDKTNKTSNIKNGLSDRTKMLCMLDVYSSDNDFDKNLFSYAIKRSIGIDDYFMYNTSIVDWYKNSDIKNIDQILKLISSKARKFTNKFNKFYDLEKKTFNT